MRVNKAMLMIRLVNRITAERDYWKEKVEAQLEGKPFVENERYERRKNNVETGVLVLYRMIESPLNSMYISK